MSADKEEFRPTPEELQRIKKALEKEEFRKLLTEYAEEISDPENKRRYEEEITELERRRGMDVKFVNPTPGFVLKTFLLPEQKKVFINVCQSEVVATASAERKKGGETWSIPYSLTPPREDYDKARTNKCMVYDVVFHPETFKKGRQNSRFKELLMDTALSGIEENHKVVLDRTNVKHLHMTYKGVPNPTVIRQKTGKPTDPPDILFPVPYPPLKEETREKPKKKKKKKKKEEKEEEEEERRPENEPHYTVTHRGEMSIQDYTNARQSTQIKRPKELVVTVELPGVKSVRTVELDILEKQLLLRCQKPDYSLDLALHYPVDEDKGSAKFDKSRSRLTVVLPVIADQTTPPSLPPERPLISEVVPELTNQARESESCDHSQESTNQMCQPESHDESLHNGEIDVPTVAKEIAGEKEASQTLQMDTSPEANQESAPVDSSQESSEAVTEGVVPQPAAVLDSESESKTKHEQVGGGGEREEVWRTGGDSVKWSSVGKWVCPPFSYRQDEGAVCFVLHTAGVKAKSLVSYFDLHLFQVTYTTVGSATPNSYSFFAQFPENCALDTANCKIDISPENIVISCSKGEGSRVEWERFTVGTNTNKTVEKLFLTEENVQQVLEEDHTDHWVASGWSSEAESRVVSASEEEVIVEVRDPRERDCPLEESRTTERKGVSDGDAAGSRSDRATPDAAMTDKQETGGVETLPVSRKPEPSELQSQGDGGPALVPCSSNSTSVCLDESAPSSSEESEDKTCLTSLSPVGPKPLTSQGTDSDAHGRLADASDGEKLNGDEESPISGSSGTLGHPLSRHKPSPGHDEQEPQSISKPQVGCGPEPEPGREGRSPQDGESTDASLLPSSKESDPVTTTSSKPVKRVRFQEPDAASSNGGGDYKGKPYTKVMSEDGSVYIKVDPSDATEVAPTSLANVTFTNELMFDLD